MTYEDHLAYLASVKRARQAVRRQTLAFHETGRPEEAVMKEAEDAERSHEALRKRLFGRT